ncbi:sodium:solute symporter family transporter [Nocardia cyriacigeorgica]|uniref:sodium:solute symporter family transporter n=1 Tax=Nocardia cyriacigeorgica TaxID=135487 RepID=UPI002454AFE1|nr:acyl-CoA dehydrogenase C-terminal domain-containing protein [Nocardia cyriacigeorgica]
MTETSTAGTWLTVAALLLAAAATVIIGGYGVRLARTTSDFLVASRSVGPRWNAAAVSGEYLSAASFLGVAGLIAKYGADALWYPVGFTAGYVGLLLFVAAPLRRSGAYTVPDFAEFRLGSLRLRRLAALVVVLICGVYLIPQFQGAGLTLRILLGVPGWVGAVAVGAIVIANVVGGGMRSITLVQAFQYWLKLTAVALPALVLLGHFLGAQQSVGSPAPPTVAQTTTVEVTTPVIVQVDAAQRVTITGTVEAPRRGGAPGPPHHYARGPPCGAPRDLGGEPAELAGQLEASWMRLIEVTAGLFADGDIEAALANSSIYLEAFGHITLAWIWLQQMLAAVGHDGDFYDGKRHAARYFFRFELPRTAPQLDLLAARDTTTLTMRDAWF